jgi:protein gp37
MGETTKIEWADMTFNPWIGCTKVSPGCDNCYAAEMMDNRYGRVKWGSGEARSRTSQGNWRKPMQWNNSAKKAGARPFVFCSSLADVFDNEVDPEWRTDLFHLIDATPNLVWLLLTKRIGNVMNMLPPYLAFPPNVAIGATMVNQLEYNRDAYKLRHVKESINPIFTFGSFEPLIGSVLLDDYAPDWIIVGGESGPNPREMNKDWARRLQSDALRLGRVFNYKQGGGRGKDKGGHELDGRTYFDRPAISALKVIGKNGGVA